MNSNALFVAVAFTLAGIAAQAAEPIMGPFHQPKPGAAQSAGS